MAWVFQIWVKSETKKLQADVRDYFNSNEVVANGKRYKIRAYDGGMVTVDGISQHGVTSQEDAVEMTAIGHEFYKLLLNSPKYMYALTGVEVDGFIELHELFSDPEYYLKIKGFVIHKKLYEKVNGKQEMTIFGNEYFWIPYEGESWKEKNANNSN